MPTASRSIARLRITSASCTRNSSSNASRRRARSFSAIDSGRWMLYSACSRSIKPSRRRTATGTGSARPRGPAAGEGILDPPGQLPRRDLGLLALRVDRHDPAGAVADQVDDRVRHLQPTPVDVRLPEQGHLQPRTQLPLPPRLVEEHHLHAPTAVADDRLDDRPTVAADPLVRRAHLDQHQRLGAGDEVSESRLVGAVDPPAGVGREQVEHGFDADLGQRRPLALTHALQPGYVVAGKLPQRDRLGVGLRHSPIPLCGGCARSLHAEQVGVQRLTAVVDLDLDRRMMRRRATPRSPPWSRRRRRLR